LDQQTKDQERAFSRVQRHVIDRSVSTLETPLPEARCCTASLWQVCILVRQVQPTRCKRNQVTFSTSVKK
jgi:hypothetical protein